MRSVLVFVIYVLKNTKLSAIPTKCLRGPFRGRDPPVGSRTLIQPSFFQYFILDIC